MPDQYTQLLEWRRAEGGARGLAKLPHDFYASTAMYLAEVRRTYEAELRENPSARKGELARQTYQRASQVARDIIEARATKVQSQAFQASVGGSRELANALAEERSLFESLLNTLRTHREKVAPFLDPGPPVGGDRASRALASPPTPSGAPATTALRPSGPPMTFVRILRDSRPLEVGKETLELRKDDVLSLPEETARLLVQGKIAEWIRSAERPAPT